MKNKLFPSETITLTALLVILATMTFFYIYQVACMKALLAVGEVLSMPHGVGDAVQRLFFYFNQSFPSLLFFFAAGIVACYYGFLGDVRKVFYAVLVLYGCFCVWFIMYNSIVVSGIRYFTAFDDVAIVMRYAKNLVEGKGLVWNPGAEHVEGFANFFWLLYMAFWHILPVGVSKIPLYLALTNTVLLLASLFLTRKIVNRVSGTNGYAVIAAVSLVATYFPISFWALRGFETALLGFIVLYSVWILMRSLDRGIIDARLYLVLALGLLTRIDFAFFYLAITMYGICLFPADCKKIFLMASAIFLLFFIGPIFFRLWYYGQPLPNVYYLKMTGVAWNVRIGHGLWYIIQFAKGISWIVCGMVLVYWWRHRKKDIINLLLYVFLIQVLYTVYVGGDSWDGWGFVANRFMSIAMVPFLIVLALAVAALHRKIAARLGVSMFTKKLCFAIIIVVVAVMIQGVGSVHQKLGRLLGVSATEVEEDKTRLRLGLALRVITTPEARIAVAWAGTIPYFTDRYCIDILGYNDAVIAHQQSRCLSWREFIPGHKKYDFVYSVQKQAPDIIVNFWDDGSNFFQEYITRYYEPVTMYGVLMYFRKDSLHIYWDRIGEV